jgi:hypothetical protein
MQADQAISQQINAENVYLHGEKRPGGADSPVRDRQMKMIFEWDEGKALSNQTKHGVDFHEAKTVFNDPLLLTYRDEQHSADEECCISIGMSTRTRLLLGSGKI